MPAEVRQNCITRLLSQCCPCLEGVSKDKTGYFKEVGDRISPDRQHSEERIIDKALLLLHLDDDRPFEDKYQEGAKVGSGAFGSVFKCKHKHTQEMRAVKLIPKGQVREEKELVLTEIEAILRLDHPNIVKCFDVFEKTKDILLVTDLCTGGDMGVYQKKRKHELRPDELQLLFRDIMMGVAYCHSVGVVHRDLKFENCLLADTGGRGRKIVKVIDFGLSAIKRETHVDTKGHESFRHTTNPSDDWLSEALGTKYFVAPEVIDKSKKYGAKCDVWSIGVMLYIVLGKEHPFAEQAPKLERRVLFDHIEKSPYREVPLKLQKVDDDAKDLLRKLLERKTKERLSATAALNEKWLKPKQETDFNKALSTVDKRVMMNRLGSFKDTSNFDKAILALVAHNAKLSEVDKMRQAFVSLDTQSDGTLTIDELKAAMKSLTDDSHFDKIDFAGLDTNKNGRINYTEFLSATMDSSIIESDKAVTELFEFFDSDGNQFISLGELTDAVGNSRDAVEAMQKHDTSKDGRIDEMEFKKIMHEIAKKRREESGE